MLDDATFSPCGRYRFTLTRHLGGGPAVAFVMLNPSTADASVNDPTIRRCMGFARAWGCGVVRVANLYAWRATKPADLWAAYQARVCITGGPENDAAIRGVVASAAIVVAAWGAHARDDRAREALELIRGAGKTPMCLGTTKHGAPRHPLMVANATALVPFGAVQAERSVA